MAGLCRRFRLETLSRCLPMAGLCPRFRLETLSRCLPMVGLCRHCLPEDTYSLPYERKLIIQARRMTPVIRLSRRRIETLPA